MGGRPDESQLYLYDLTTGALKNRITTGDKYLDSGKLYVAKFNADGDLLDKQLLVQAYMIAAINYINIADKFDDMAFSDRTVAGANYGEAGMVALYDSATKWLDAANSLATGDNKAYVLALRARAKQLVTLARELFAGDA